MADNSEQDDDEWDQDDELSSEDESSADDSNTLYTIPNIDQSPSAVDVLLMGPQPTVSRQQQIHPEPEKKEIQQIHLKIVVEEWDQCDKLNILDSDEDNNRTESPKMSSFESLDASKSSNSGSIVDLLLDGDRDKMIDVLSKKDNMIQIRLFLPLSDCVTFRKGEKGDGLQIESYCDNKYGTQMESLGIGIGWKLFKIGERDVTSVEQLLPHDQSAIVKEGYEVTFIDTTIKHSDIEKREETSVIQELDAEPVSSSQEDEQEDGIEEEPLPFWCKWYNICSL
eukprot:341974_1